MASGSELTQSAAEAKAAAANLAVNPFAANPATLLRVSTHPNDRGITLTVASNEWHVYEPTQPLAELSATDLPAQALLISFKNWVAARDLFAAHYAKDFALGLLIAPDDDVVSLKDRFELFKLIAIDFPKFTDGRGFSSAYILRTRLGWQGELRAVGQVLVDQLQPMYRSGFNSFLLSPGQSTETAQRTIQAFSNHYQANAIEPLPIYRRRAGTASLRHSVGATEQTT